MSRRKPLKGDPQKESREALALKIGQWAFDELEYSEEATRPVVASACKVFQNLSKGVNGKLWENVINNVKRVKTDGPINACTSKALKKLSELNEHSKALDLELMREISNVEELQKTATTLQSKIDKDLNQISHLQRVTVMLESKSEETKSKALHFTRVNNHLRESFELLKKPDEIVDESFSIASTCQKVQKRKILATNLMMEIEKNVYSLCYDHSIGKLNTEEESFNKRILTAQIIDLKKNISLKTIMKCLSHRAQEATNDVTKLTNAFSIRGQMSDLGERAASMGDGKGDLIHEIEDKCMQHHFHTLRCKHAKIDSEYRMIRNQIETLLLRRKKLEEKMAALISDSSKRQMISDLLKSEIGLKNAETKLSAIRKEINLIETSEFNPSLNEKLEIIEETERLIRQKHISILSALSTNAKMKAEIVLRFQNRKDARLMFTQMNLCNNLTSIEIWKEKMALGFRMFCELDIENLSRLKIKDQVVPYTKTNLSLIERNPFLSQIKDIFNVSRVQSFDYLMKRAINEKQMYAINGDICPQQVQLINEMKIFQAKQRQFVEDYQKRLKDLNREMAQCVPVIKEFLNEIPLIEQRCKETAEQINTWWTLPAFNVKF